MITFKVDNVKPGHFEDKQSKWDNNQNNLNELVGTGIESYSDLDSQITAQSNNLIAALNTAYDCHLPVVLSPDILWQAIAQGLSAHINNNAEKLRHHFVNFEGKKDLVVFEDSFVKGSSENNWPHMFGQFSDQISEYIGKKRDLIVGNYSTSTIITKAANEIVLMEAMQNYFAYTCVTCCGIPEITLLGTLDDWKSIKTRVQAMAEFDLGWWTSHLEPIVDEFINAAQGNANVSFWQNIYKRSGGSGGPFISGWITTLFPYLRKNRKNKFGKFSEITSRDIPAGISKVPFKWVYHGTEYKMELAAGYTGFKVQDNVVTPNIGWVVRDTENKSKLKFESGSETEQSNFETQTIEINQVSKSFDPAKIKFYEKIGPAYINPKALNKGNVYMATEPEYIGEFPKANIEVFPADDPKQKAIGWIMKRNPDGGFTLTKPKDDE